MLRWALTAAAVFTLLFAIRTVFSGTKEESDGRQKLGCGFGLLSAGLWAYVLNDYVGSWWTGLRVGIGVLLLLPAASALAKPQGASVLRALLALVVGVLLIGPVARDLWEEHGPDDRPEAVIGLEEQLAEARALEAQLRERERGLVELRREIRADVSRLGSTWEELEENDEALRKLDVLQTVDQQLARVQGALVRLAAQVPELEARLAEVEREGAAVAGSGAASGDPALDALRRELEEAPSLEELSLVEQYAKKKELQAVFEREF